VGYQAWPRPGGRSWAARSAEVITVNGVRVALEDGSWVLVRASSNKPEIVVVVESTRSADDMRALFRDEVKPRLAQGGAEVGAYNQERLHRLASAAARVGAAASLADSRAGPPILSRGQAMPIAGSFQETARSSPGT
jgi:hypothetical protein